ncbi:MAG: type 4a pilus biogenesis protein PilO [Nitrospiraceae bacterium]
MSPLSTHQPTAAAERSSWAALLYQPYAIVVPWASVMIAVGLLWAALHLLVLDHARADRAALEQQRTALRAQVNHAMDVRQARVDMARVLNMLPAQRDFAPLALGLTEQAKAHRLHVPGLTYHLEKTDVPTVYRAVLEGTATGRYEDLRRYIQHLETADELVVIEHLDVDRARNQSDTMTIHLKVATYLRGGVSTGNNANAAPKHASAPSASVDALSPTSGPSEG